MEGENGPVFGIGRHVHAEAQGVRDVVNVGEPESGSRLFVVVVIVEQLNPSFRRDRFSVTPDPKGRRFIGRFRFE